MRSLLAAVAAPVAFLLTFILLETPDKSVASLLEDKNISALVSKVEATSEPNQISVDGVPLLIRAAAEADADTVAALLETGLDIDIQDENGNTPLMTAVETGRLDIVDVLYGETASLFILNSEGETAADLAARFGYSDLARKLTPPPERQARNNARLLNAIVDGDAGEVYRSLIAGGDLEARTVSDEGVFVLAARAFDWNVVAVLIHHAKTRQPNVLLSSNDIRSLFDAMFLYPEGSQERVFIVRAIKELRAQGYVAEKTMHETLRRDGFSSEEVRELLRSLGMVATASGGEGNTFRHQTERPLQALEYDLAIGRPLGGELRPRDWKAQQRRLAALGLYKGAIDGVPGTGTFDAIYAYGIALAPVIVERATYAAKRAAKAEMHDLPHRFGHAVSTTNTGLDITIRGERSSERRSSPTGYFVTEWESSRGTKGFGYVYSLGHISNNFRGDEPIFSVTSCESGLAIFVVFPLLGGKFRVHVKDDGATYHYTGIDGRTRDYRVPGNAPRIQCPQPPPA